MTTFPPIIFPDVELWASTWARGALAGRPESYAQDVYVGNSTPTDRRDRMVTFRRDGGPRLDVVREAARLGVNVWGSTEQEATNLARLIAALLGAAADGEPVLRVQQTLGPSPVVDQSGQPRLYMTFEVVLRGVPL